jgi:predicted extracellular nuclease
MYTIRKVILKSLILLILIILANLRINALPNYPVISEIVVDVSGAESDSELVEIYNPTGQVINIGGYKIVYKTSTGTTWSTKSVIPDGETIPAFGYYLTAGDKVIPAADNVDTSLGFSGSGGHIGIKDANDNVIDYVGYGC